MPIFFAASVIELHCASTFPYRSGIASYRTFALLPQYFCLHVVLDLRPRSSWVTLILHTRHRYVPFAKQVYSAFIASVFRYSQHHQQLQNQSEVEWWVISPVSSPWFHKVLLLNITLSYVLAGNVRQSTSIFIQPCQVSLYIFLHRPTMTILSMRRGAAAGYAPGMTHTIGCCTKQLNTKGVYSPPSGAGRYSVPFRNG